MAEHKSIEEYLTEDELKEVKQLLQDLNTAKIKLADGFLEMEQVKSVLKIIKEKLVDNERQLVTKYGKEARINLDTGKVTKQYKPDTKEKS